MAFDFPATPSDGQKFTPSGGPTYIWVAATSAWKIQGSIGASGNAYVSDTPPLSPQPGQFWWESDTGNMFMWFDDGNSQQWVQVNVPNVSGLATSKARNRIVNGAMQISQENGNTAGTATGYYPADQWTANFISSSTITVGRGAGAVKPHGSISVIASPAETSAAAGETVAFLQRIEGNRISDFFFGTANPRQVIIAFDVVVPVAGTYWIAFSNQPVTHTFLASYSIAAAEVGTWVRKSVVIPAGVVNAGTWATDNSVGARLFFSWHCGSTYTGVAGFQVGDFRVGPGQALGLSTASNCLLTNVGLYLDDGFGIAPVWEMPDEATELAACQRYWLRMSHLFSGNVTSGQFYYAFSQRPPMRANPILTGVNEGGTASFPTTAGTLTGGQNGFQTENRAANATAMGVFQTLVTANARM